MPPSDEAVVEAGKAAVQKSTQKDTAWCILRSNGLPTYYRTLPGTVVATHGAPLAASLMISLAVEVWLHQMGSSYFVLTLKPYTVQPLLSGEITGVISEMAG